MVASIYNLNTCKADARRSEVQGQDHLDYMYRGFSQPELHEILSQNLRTKRMYLLQLGSSLRLSPQLNVSEFSFSNAPITQEIEYK